MSLPAQPASETHDQTIPSCEYNSDQAGPVGIVDVNDALPSADIVDQCGQSPVLDREGNSILLKDVYGPSLAQGKRVLLIFVRHFYCGLCQDYLSTLSKALPPALLAQATPPLDIIIIGHGGPSLIPFYETRTNCPYAMYTDPSRALFRQLNLGSTLDLGPRPSYQQAGTWTNSVASAFQIIKHVGAGRLGGDFARGGDFSQVGGEVLLEVKERSHSKDSEADAVDANRQVVCSWIHRMRSTRDHTELPALASVLGVKVEGQALDEKQRDVADSSRA